MSPAPGPRRPDTNYERGLARAGLRYVAGLDEAGRGALAGPVVAAAVILPSDISLVEADLEQVRDSKVLSSAERTEALEHILRCCVASATGTADHQEVDQWGIVQATRLAMMRALDRLIPAPEHLLLDHLLLPDCPTPQTALTDGDARVLSIAAASILAKVTRDNKMVACSHRYPGYHLETNMGYGTPQHRLALEELGPCRIHRRTFAPVRLQLGLEESLEA